VFGSILSLTGGLISQTYQDSARKRDYRYEVLREQQRSVVAAFDEVTGRIDDVVFAGLALSEALTRPFPADSASSLASSYWSARRAWRQRLSRSIVLFAVDFSDSTAGQLRFFEHRFEQMDSFFLDLSDRRAYSARVRPQRDSLAVAVHRSAQRLDSLAFSAERGWAFLIQLRRTGSFDPFAEFGDIPSRHDSQ
jgi:hypothetical protein